MNYFTFLFALVILVFLNSCSTIKSVDYIGDHYVKTSKVDIFYDATIVVRDFHIMGQAIGTRGSYEKIIDKLTVSAMEKGADAVLLTELDRVGGSGESGPCNQIKASFLKYK